MSIMSSWHLCMQMFTRDNQPLPKGTVPYTPHRHCGDCGIRIYSITWHGLGLDALLDLDRLGMVSSKRNTIRACFGRRKGRGGGETRETPSERLFLLTPEESVGWDGMGRAYSQEKEEGMGVQVHKSCSPVQGRRYKRQDKAWARRRARMW